MRSNSRRNPWTRWTTSWDTFRQSSGNPLDPTPQEEMAEVLEPAEQAELAAHVRTVIESGPLVPRRSASVYLRAVKGSS